MLKIYILVDLSRELLRLLRAFSQRLQPRSVFFIMLQQMGMYLQSQGQPLASVVEQFKMPGAEAQLIYF